MNTLVAFLGLVFGLGLAVGAVAAVGTLAVRVAVGNPLRSADEDVMPSHYASLVNTTPSKFPGYCPECGTNNDPEFSVCKHCSATLPTSHRTQRSDDTNSILNE